MNGKGQSCAYHNNLSTMTKLPFSAILRCIEVDILSSFPTRSRGFKFHCQLLNLRTLCNAVAYGEYATYFLRWFDAYIHRYTSDQMDRERREKSHQRDRDDAPLLEGEFTILPDGFIEQVPFTHRFELSVNVHN